jgi:HlyD family secretion protein
MNKTNITLTVASVALVALLGYGVWRAAQPAPPVFQGQMEAH